MFWRNAPRSKRCEPDCALSLQNRRSTNSTCNETHGQLRPFVCVLLNRATDGLRPRRRIISAVAGAAMESAQEEQVNQHIDKRMRGGGAGFLAVTIGAWTHNDLGTYLLFTIGAQPALSRMVNFDLRPCFTTRSETVIAGSRARKRGHK
jgi:hypothetical protein